MLFASVELIPPVLLSVELEILNTPPLFVKLVPFKLLFVAFMELLFVVVFQEFHVLLLPVLLLLVLVVLVVLVVLTVLLLLVLDVLVVLVLLVEFP